MCQSAKRLIGCYDVMAVGMPREYLQVKLAGLWQKISNGSIDGCAPLWSYWELAFAGDEPLFARINFLAGLGMLVLAAFYFVGVYLILVPVSHFAPAWGSYLAGAIVLIAMGITVQSLASAMSGFAGVARYVSGRSSVPLFFAAQVALICAHALTIYSVASLVAEYPPASNIQLLLTVALYATGVALALYEWKQRTALSA